VVLAAVFGAATLGAWQGSNRLMQDVIWGHKDVIWGVTDPEPNPPGP
jgi:hypothetical protein